MVECIAAHLSVQCQQRSALWRKRLFKYGFSDLHIVLCKKSSVIKEKIYQCEVKTLENCVQIEVKMQWITFPFFNGFDQFVICQQENQVSIFVLI